MNTTGQLRSDFRLGDAIVRPQRRLIERDNISVHIKPKSMAVLECLAAADGATVSRNDLFDKVWAGAEVTDDTLTRCIVELRKAFGDSARESRVIETIPKLGFRLVLPVRFLESGPSSPEDQPSPHRESRRPGYAWILLIGTALACGILLSSPGARSWLSEAGGNLFLKTAALVAPYPLEQRPGIAVLPFVNTSDDPEIDYFSDGMSAEIINALARSSSLPVVARTSSFQFKGQNRDIREIGRLLGVTHILEGSVRKQDQNIRMTVQLSDTATGALVWSGVYQSQLDDLFTLQNNTAKKIVNRLDTALGREHFALPGSLPKIEFMKARPPSNSEAYDLYLKGVEMVTSKRPALVAQAAGYFDRAIALEADYADAWAGRGFALATLAGVGNGFPTIPATVLPDAIAAFRRALEIEPEHAFAMGWLGWALMTNDFKWAEGMQLIKESLSRNPNDATLLAVYGFYLETLDMEGADEVSERAYRLDPLGYEPIVDRAIHLSRQGRWLDAASLAETALIADREGYGPNYFAVYFNLQLDRLESAEEYLRKAREVALPVDLNLDVMQWEIDRRRGKGSLPLAEIRERMQTEKLDWAVLWDGFTSAEQIVGVYDLAIRQRMPALRTALFGPKPPLMPEAEWQRIREITGVTQFLAGR